MMEILFLLQLLDLPVSYFTEGYTISSINCSNDWLSYMHLYLDRLVQN